MIIEKHKTPVALLTAILTILLFYGLHTIGFNVSHKLDHITVGFICNGDEATPYSENFLRSIDYLQMQYPDAVKVILRDNVPSDEVGGVIDELIAGECSIIFANSADYGETMKKAAAENPGVEFCQAACSNANDEPVCKNYHTFMGEIYEGWYTSGKIAGLKLQELIDSGKLSRNEAVVGCVGAFPCDEVISAYTAFFLGVRSECPDAVMHVKYTNTWSNYNLEYNAALDLISEGCVIIAQNTDTIGPAVACERSTDNHTVFHIGYNKDMMSIAPTTSLISTRIDWSVYISQSVEAVMNNKRIESAVKAHIQGNDAWSGFKQDWVKMLELNPTIAPERGEEVLNETIESFKNGDCRVFYGDYIGVSPDDPNDVWDLNLEFYENKESSAPSYHYVLQDVIIIDP